MHRVLEPFINWAYYGGRWDQGFLDLNVFYGSPANDTLKRILELPLSQWPALTLYKRMRGPTALAGRDARGDRRQDRS